MINFLNNMHNMNPYIGALVIFFFRIIDVSLGTYRIQMIVSRKKLLAGIIGFIEVFIFILIISQVVQCWQLAQRICLCWRLWRGNYYGHYHH